MRSLTHFRRARLLPAAAVLGLTMLVSPVHIGAVHAGLGTCANCYGPIIMLSDGTKINTGVNVSDETQDIQGVAYTVHIPSGLAVKNMSFQGSNQVSQSANVVADESTSNTYQVETVVSTGAPSIAVSSSTQVNLTGTNCVQSSSTTGQSNTTISTYANASSC